MAQAARVSLQDVANEKLFDVAPVHVREMQENADRSRRLTILLGRETDPRNFEELREIDSDFSFPDVEESAPPHFAARLTVFWVVCSSRSRTGAGAVRSFASSLVPGLAERDDFSGPMFSSVMLLTLAYAEPIERGRRFCVLPHSQSRREWSLHPIFRERDASPEKAQERRARARP